MKEKLKDIFCKKTGTNYLILRIPKEIFELMPQNFFIDLEIQAVRDSNPPDKKKFRRKKR